MKRYVRNTINLSCAKILLTSVSDHTIAHSFIDLGSYVFQLCYSSPALHGNTQTEHTTIRIILLKTDISGPGSSVGIATAYGLDGPGIESRWGEIFRTCPDRP